jgi:phosphodiesterase/alkaline phosphatase D-like protein
MKRSVVRGTVLALSLAVIVLAACFAPALPAIGGEVHASSGVTFTAAELLGRPTDTSITVNVVPSANGQVYFKYGTATGVYSGQTSTAALISGTPTEVVIQGLTPNTRYYYRMVSSENGIDWVDGDEHSFQTQRSPGSTFTFTITSDSHVNIVLGSATMWQQTMTNVANDHPDFEIDCGDTFAMDSVTTVSGAEQAYLYQRQFFDIVGNSAPIFLAIGNHEQEEAWHLDDPGNPATSPPVLAANARKKFYLNPVPDGFYSGNTDPYSYLDGDHLREDYYAWTWGDALFVVIDPYWYTTTKPYIAGGNGESYGGSGDRWDWTLGLQQFNWLKQTLENSHVEYKFIFAHHMTGGANDYGGRGGAVPANLVEWGGYNVNGITWGWDTKRPVSQ